MTPETFPEPDDDPAFLNWSIASSPLIDRHAPEELYLAHCNWFDHNGCVSRHRSGPSMVLSIHTVLDEFSQEQLTFPPFTPNRVVTQHYFNRGPEGQLSRTAAGPSGAPDHPRP